MMSKKWEEEINDVFFAGKTSLKGLLFSFTSTSLWKHLFYPLLFKSVYASKSKEGINLLFDFVRLASSFGKSSCKRHTLKEVQVSRTSEHKIILSRQKVEMIVRRRSNCVTSKALKDANNSHSSKVFSSGSFANFKLQLCVARF